MVKHIFILLVLIIALSSDANAQEWQGIRLLHSTCEDVKRIFNLEKCEYPATSFQFGDEFIRIEFSQCPCPINYTSVYEAIHWNVPKGTVIEIYRNVRNVQQSSEFNLNDETWIKIELNNDQEGSEVYVNKVNKGNISLSAINGKIYGVRYSPSSIIDSHLLCPKSEYKKIEIPDLSAYWNSTYRDMSFEEEKKHLDDFANKMMDVGHDSVGFIVVYVGCDMEKSKGSLRLKRAMRYLTKKYGKVAKRIKTIEAGQSVSFGVDLYVAKKGTPPPPVFPDVYLKVGNKLERK